MTLKELIEKIKSDSIEVDFGRAFLDFRNPKAYLIEKLEEQLERVVQMSDKQKSLFEKAFGKKGSDELEVVENGSLTFGMMNYLKLHSFIISKELYICLEDNKIVFKGFDKKKDWRSTDLILPNIEEGIEKPLVTSISVPSKKLAFANFFSKEISPEMENPYASENSLNGILGRRNHARHYEKHGVLYGQTTNTSLQIWVNKTNTEIIVTERSFDEWFDSCEEDFDSPEEWQEYLIDHKDSLAFCDWLKQNGFKANKNHTICCDMWRFEATDSKKDQGEFQIPIAGNSVVMEHYFDSIQKSPISKFIVSKITVR
jgi:hypothetical protein